MTSRWVVAIAGVSWLGVVAACADRAPGGEHEGVLDLISASTDATDDSPVTGSALPDDIVAAHAPAGVSPFSVLTRSSKLQKAPCDGCHTEPLAAMRWTGEDSRVRAHWAVELSHASESVMTCLTCHDEGNLDALRTLAGAPVDVDHGYEVCAQCHSTQAADWAGGAHGKRASGWAQVRVVYSCTECHNPHQPLLPARWPARAGRTSR